MIQLMLVMVKLMLVTQVVKSHCGTKQHLDNLKEKEKADAKKVEEEKDEKMVEKKEKEEIEEVQLDDDDVNDNLLDAEVEEPAAKKAKEAA